MSDTLRYMNYHGKLIEGEAANAFFQNKLRANMSGRYTQQQINRLNQSGGPAVVNSNDGYVPTGPAYPQNNYLNEPKSGGDGGAAGGTGSIVDFKEGIKSKNQFNSESLKEHFGLESVAEDKAYSKGSSTGTKQTAGLGTYMTKDDYNRLKNDDKVWEAYAAINGKDAMKDKRESGEMSINTLDALFDDLSKEGGKAEADGPAKEQKPDPIRHSPEIKQATERVRTYENDVLSGKISDDIFGGNKLAGNNSAFDSNKGIGGIGTEVGVKTDETAPRATASFLDNKKTQIKKDFKIEPIKYGAN